MLKILLGKARAGKTAAIMEEISNSVQNQVGNQVLLVPDQYSHEAERELAESCGDSASIYAEVMTFDWLAKMVSNKVGGNPNPYLDESGKLLCMAVAIEKCAPSLKVFSSSLHKLDMQELLLSFVDEMKLSQISPELLSEIADASDDVLATKLNELSTICAAYEGVVSCGHTDPSDSIIHLAEQIPSLDFSTYHFYIDGFTDFTNAEIEVIKALLSQKASITICMTVDSLLDNSGVFSPARNSIKKLIHQVDSIGIKADVTMFPQRGRSFADDIFEFTNNEPNIDIDLFTCNCIEDECELAASKIIELVRDKGCRYRDISIAIRGFEDYSATLKSVLKQYGIPLFAAQRSPISSKPLAALIQYSYNIILNGWRPDDIISYLGTGLINIPIEKRDLISSYLLRWDIREGQWYSSKNWSMHPDGYDGKQNEKTTKDLEEINRIRKLIFEPLSKFEEASKNANTAAEQSKALSSFLKSIEISKMLDIRAEKLLKSGDSSAAEEYSQLWEIIVNAIEQIYSILGSSEIETIEFAKLFLLLLSKYDVGIIPVSLDMVNAGDFVRMRRRNIKHLIILGADANRLPKSEDEATIFTSDEIKKLRSTGVQFRFSDEGEIWREFSLIYNCLSLPKDSLTLSCVEGDSGKSFVMTRAEQLCHKEAVSFDVELARTNSKFPALILAASSTSQYANASKKYFEDTSPDLINGIISASSLQRGKLSESSVSSLYGESLDISASRVDAFYSCKYGYFCQYGLRAKKFEPADFSPKTLGNFSHFVLENLAREIKDLGGFKAASEKKVRIITDKYIAIYVHDELHDFEDKNERFRFLFNRVCEGIHRVVQETVKEIQGSKFEPESFELNFDGKDENGEFPSIPINDDNDKLKLSGIADRVDTWDDDGTTYFRVIDYKTGSKKFSLSEIWYGLSMQMLLYLYELEMYYNGARIPAGVMYLPVRDKYLSFNQNPSEEEILKKKSKDSPLTGLMLDVDGMAEAWSNSETNLGMMTSEQFSLLCNHMKNKIGTMAKEIREGSIEADPYRIDNTTSACNYCAYKSTCGFINGEKNEREKAFKKMTNDEIWGLLQGGASND